MKRILLITILLFFCSCQNKDEQNFLYNQLLNYRNELKASINSERDFLYEKVYKNELYKKIFDSLAQINNDCEKSFERLRYGNKKELLNYRDEFNSKHKLNLKFDSYNTSENVNDSIFNKLTEVDFLRLRKRFQERYMWIQGCK